MKKITVKEFKELYQTSEITVLDVREKGEFQDGHIPTAKNYPLSTLEKEYAILSPNQKYSLLHQCKLAKHNLLNVAIQSLVILL